MSGDELDEADEMELSAADFVEDPGPRIDAFDITARAREAYGADGRPALPRMATWPIFPFEVDGLRVRTLEEPVLPEPPRHGEGGDRCRTCAAPDEDFLWAGDGWRVSMPVEPHSLPALTVHPRDHLDFHELTEELGAELGVLLVRCQRALSSVDGVGRVHVYKWGDGGAHLHVVLMARPAGMMQLRGAYLSTWADILPPLPTGQWQTLRTHLTIRLAGGGGW